MEEPKTQGELIITKAEALFLRYGIKSITMDDLAREMAISKKTLYQFCENKNDLVRQVMQRHIEAEQENITAILNSQHNAIEEMVAIGRYVAMHLRSLNHSVMYDLQKYHQDAWGLFMNYKNTFVYRVFLSNMEKGRKEGLYREDFDIEIIALFYLARMEYLINPEFFPSEKFPVLSVYVENLKYHLRGICSDQGSAYFEKNLNRITNELSGSK